MSNEVILIFDSVLLVFVILGFSSFDYRDKGEIIFLILRIFPIVFISHLVISVFFFSHYNNLFSPFVFLIVWSLAELAISLCIVRDTVPNPIGWINFFIYLIVWVKRFWVYFSA